MGVATEVRHRKILKRIHQKGRIYVKQVAETLSVTEVTVRRDLAFLERKGLVKKTYGGAVLSAPEVETSVRYRQKKKVSAKKTVGQLAGQLVDRQTHSV